MVMKKTNRSVLLVEDHKELAETVGEYLEASDYIVDYLMVFLQLIQQQSKESHCQVAW